jgi:hypothetical protein
VERAGRVSRHELYVDRARHRRGNATVVNSLPANGVDFRLHNGRLEPDVHEAGPRHLGAFDQVVSLVQEVADEILGDLARRPPQGTRQLQGRVGRKVTMLRRTRTNDLYGGVLKVLPKQRLQRTGQDMLDALSDRRHRLPTSFTNRG